FLSGTTNPTRFSILLYHNNTDAQFQEVISALERRKVRYVLWDTLVDGQNLKQWFPNYQQPPREKLMIEPYLNEHYDLIGIKRGLYCYGAELAEVEVPAHLQQRIFSGVAAENLPPAFRNSIEIIVLGDVIEHLAEPVPFLRSLVQAFPALKGFVLAVPARAEL